MSTVGGGIPVTGPAPPNVILAGTAALAPFVPPRLVRTGVARAFALLTRVAMVVWAYAIGVIGVRWDGDREAVHRAVTLMTISAAAIGTAWIVSAAWWSVLRTRNVHRLEGRFPTEARAGRVWIYPLAWVVLMTATVVRAAPHPEFDPRPMIIVTGFLVAMVSPYRVIQRIFRSLVRVQPDAAVFVLYIVDTIAFGVIWWRLAVWPAEAAQVDRATVDLLGGSAFAAGVALLIGLWLSVYLDRETDRSEDIRVLALRTRHDHRLARLQGLDPMDRATRWALWLARQAADHRVVVEEPVAPATVPSARVEPPVASPLAPVLPLVEPAVIAAVDTPVDAPVDTVLDVAPVDEAPTEAQAGASAPTDETLDEITDETLDEITDETLDEITDDTVDEITDETLDEITDETLDETTDEVVPTSTAALLRERVLRAIGLPEVDDEVAEPSLPTLPERAAPYIPDVAAALGSISVAPEDTARDETLPDEPMPAETVSDGASGVLDPGARLRALQHRIGASTSGTGSGDADAVARALQRRLSETQRRAERGARRPSLAGRLTPSDDTATVSTVAERLAARLGADLERGGGSEFAARVRELSEQYHREPSAASSLPSAELGEPDSARTSRGLVPPRLMLVESCRFLALVLLAVAAAGMVWVLVLSARQGDGARLDDIDLARSVAIHALGLSHVFVLAWLSAAAEVSKRVESSVRWWPFVVLAAVSAPFMTSAVVLEFGDADQWSVVALAVATVACAAGLRLIAFPNEMLGRPAGALNAWMVGVIALLVVLVASPLTSAIDDEVARDSLVFGAIVTGLALLVVSVLGGVVMSQYEDVLRSSSELAVERSAGNRRAERERTGQRPH